MKKALIIRDDYKAIVYTFLANQYLLEFYIQSA